MINRYWQVLRTYLERPRFWVLIVTYLLVTWFWFWYYAWSKPGERQAQAIISAIYACLICCFLGLHVRRQFSHSAAQAIPGYATPHLVVAGLLSSMLWLVVPALAWWMGHWSNGVMALHAFAAMLMAIVACWPRGVLLMMAIPAVAIWASRPVKARQYPYIVELYQGYHPNVAVMLIAAAVGAQAIAAWYLLRLPRKGITTNDEFTIETAPTPAGVNPLRDWLLELRESEAQRLTRTGWLPLVQRWRAPVAIAPMLFLVPAAFVSAAALFGWWAEEAQAYTTFALIISCAILLLLPLGPWQSRRWAMSQEILRPVAREKYYRQFLGAMALDMVTWIGMASLLIFVVILSNWNHISPMDRLTNFSISLALSLSLLWSMATFVYGVGVATLHVRFWLPILAAATITWFVGCWILGGIVGMYFRVPSDVATIGLSSFPILSTAIGLGLTRWTYQRWVRSDVV